MRGLSASHEKSAGREGDRALHAGMPHWSLELAVPDEVLACSMEDDTALGIPEAPIGRMTGIESGANSRM